MATKRGYLTKEGGSHKTWKRRWCVLVGNSLSYYKTPEDETPQGTIYLEEYRDAVKTDNRPKVKLCFALQSVSETGRVYYFAAETATDLNEWITAIKSVLEAINKVSRGPIRRYITVEVGAVRGLLVDGNVHPSILRDLSENIPSAQKSVDERGWLCDEVYSIEKVLSVFTRYSWTLVNAYDSILISSRLGQQPCSHLILGMSMGNDALQHRESSRKTKKNSHFPVNKQPILVPPTNGFHVEDGISGRLFAGFNDSSAVVVENPESENAWYKLYFTEREHEHFISNDRDNPFAMSIIREVDRQASEAFYQYRVIVWLSTGNEQLTIPVQEKETLTPGQILEIAAPYLANMQNTLRQVSSASTIGAELAAELLKIENEQCTNDFKFGVLYCKKGQTSERQMFGNETSSPELDEFLTILGDRINLKGWTGFRGGLSITETTGKESVFTKFGGYNVMFHVSTLLPFTASDPQQLERKRHIGNDIITIVFQDEPGIRFSPLTISSQFLHIFFVIERLGVSANGQPQYRMNVCSNDKVPAYGPQLPLPPIWTNKDDFRQFLLIKMINAEKAAYKAPAFQARRKRTLSSLLQNIQERFFAEAKKGTAQRRLNQEAQTNRRESSNDDSSPLQKVDDQKKWVLRPEVLQAPHEILSGVFWGRSRVLFGTNVGFAIGSDGDYSEIVTDKKRQHTQLKIVPEMGIVLTIATKTGAHPNLMVHNLADLDRTVTTGWKIEECRHVSCFDVHLNSDSNELLLLAAIKRVAILFVYQPSSSQFVKLKDLTLPEAPSIIQFVTADTVFMASQAGFVRVGLKDGSVQPIPLPNQTARIDPISILSVEQEVLLSYNNFTIVVSQEGKQPRDVVFKWSATPLSVVFLQPFVVGVSSAQIEIRSLLNGNLLETKSATTKRCLCARSANASFGGELLMTSASRASNSGSNFQADNDASSTNVMRLTYSTS